MHEQEVTKESFQKNKALHSLEEIIQMINIPSLLS